MDNQHSSDRRDSTERRVAIDRRRSSDARVAVIEICQSVLHLAVVAQAGDTQQDKVITRSIRWRKESSSLHTDQGVQELTEAFRTLVAEERISGAKVRIALDGELCVTRVVTGSTEHVRHELMELEERSELYLSLGPGRKTVASSIWQLDARHQHALLTVANQKTLDILVEIGTTVGIQLEAVEPSLVALSRVQAQLRDGCQEVCLIIQLDEQGAELGICHQGQLLLDYRPGGCANAENVAQIVSQHLKRLQRYLDRHHGHLKTSLRQVYLTGNSEAVAKAEREFVSLEQFDVSKLDPSQIEADWEYVDSTPDTDMAAALGAAIWFNTPETERQGPNLLAQMLADLREPMRPILLRSAIPVAAVLLVAVGMLALLLHERSGTSVLQAELDLLAPVRARATHLSQTLIASESKLAQLKEIEQQVPNPDWGALITHIGQSMPNDVWIDRLSFQDGQTASLTGASYTDSGMYDFVNYLKKAPEFDQVDLQGTGIGHSRTGPTTNFELALSLVNFADKNEGEDRND